MVNIEILPRVVRRGEKITVRIQAIDPALRSAKHVDIKAEPVGHLRGYGYIWFVAYQLNDDFVGEYEVRAEDQGQIWCIVSITFIGDGKSTPLIGSRDFPPTYFAISDVGREMLDDELASKAAELQELRNREFLLGFGTRTPSSKDHDVFVFYRNCFVRAGDIVLRQARIFRLEGIGANDVLQLVDNFLRGRFGLQRSAFHSYQAISDQFRRSVPCVAIWFPRVAAESKKQAIGVIFRKAEDLATLLSLDTGASPQLIVAGALDELGESEWIFRAPRYVGNLVPPFAPSDHFLNAQLEALHNHPQQRFYLALHQDAAAETNDDIAYFRYWVLFESIARGQGSGKGIAGVRKMLAMYSKARSRNLDANLNGRSYDGEYCLKVWNARRNITAHYGAFDPTSTTQRQDRRNFEVALAALRETQSARTEIFLMYLRTLATDVVRWLLWKN